MSGAAGIPEIRIFICSSGDVQPERDIALQVIARLEAELGGLARLIAYRWEDLRDRFAAEPTWQANIELPERFDIVLAILFSRIGKPLTEGEYRGLMAQTAQTAEEAAPTGTQFEIENALAGHAARGRPLLWTARNEAIPGHERLPTPQRREAQGQYDALGAYLEDLAARNIVIQRYGEGALRAQQLASGGLGAFAGLLDTWLRQALDESFGLRLTWSGDAYVGLRPFAPDQAPIFFGRHASTAEALGLLERAGDAGRPRLMLVTGPSGAGKSSFVRAGLVGALPGFPLMRRDVSGAGARIAPWVTLVLRPAELQPSPAVTLLRRLDGVLPMAPGALADLEAGLAATTFDTPAARLPHPLAEALRGQVQATLLQHGPHAGLFVVLDQLEDLFATPDPPAARALLALLRALAEAPAGNLRVVVALADQWRSELSAEGLEPQLEGAEHFALPPLRPGELREVIEAPARRAGLRFGSAPDGRPLDEVIREDLQDLSLAAQAPLPLLQAALRQLERQREGRVLTHAAYRAMGGLRGAIEAHAADALGPWEQGARRAVLERLLFHLLQRDPQQRVVSRLAPLAELEADPEVWACAQHLMAEQTRLLQGSGEARAATVRLLHDVLLEQSATLRDFLARERENILLLERQRDAAAAWALAQRPGLLSGDQEGLAKLPALMDRAGVPADDVLRRFVGASLQAIAAAERARRRRARLAIAAAVVFAVLGVAATGFGLVALEQRREATAQRSAAQAQAIRLAFAADDPFTAIRLLTVAQAAGEVAADSDEALALRFWAPLLVPRAEALAALPAGQSFDWLGRSYLRQGEAGARALPGDRARFAVAREGQDWIMLQDAQDQLRLLQRATLREVAAFPLADVTITGVSLPPAPGAGVLHGTLQYGFSAGSSLPVTWLFDPSRPARGLLPIPLPSLPFGAADDACTRPWLDLDLEHLELAPGGAWAMALYGGRGGESRRELVVHRLDGRPGPRIWPVERAVIGPAGRQLLVMPGKGAGDARPRLFDMAAGDLAGRPLPADGASEAIFGPQGEWLALAGDQLVLVPLQGGAPRVLLEEPGLVRLAADPRGRWLGVVDRAWRLRIFDVSTGRQILDLPGAVPGGELLDLAYLRRGIEGLSDEDEAQPPFLSLSSEAGMVLLQTGIGPALAWRLRDGRIESLTLPGLTEGEREMVALHSSGLRRVVWASERVTMTDPVSGRVLLDLPIEENVTILADPALDLLVAIRPVMSDRLGVTEHRPGAGPLLTRLLPWPREHRLSLSGGVLLQGLEDAVMAMPISSDLPAQRMMRPVRGQRNRVTARQDGETVTLGFLDQGLLLRHSLTPDGMPGLAQRHEVAIQASRRLDLSRFPPPLLDADAIPRSPRTIMDGEQTWKETCLEAVGEYFLAFPSLRPEAALWEDEPGPDPSDLSLFEARARAGADIQAWLATRGLSMAAVDERLEDLLAATSGAVTRHDVAGGTVLEIETGMYLGRAGGVALLGLPEQGAPRLYTQSFTSGFAGQQFAVEPGGHCILIADSNALGGTSFRILRAPDLALEDGAGPFPGGVIRVFHAAGDRLAIANANGFITLYRRPPSGCAYRPEAMTVSLPISAQIVALDRLAEEEATRGQVQLDAIRLTSPNRLLAAGNFGVMALRLEDRQVAWRLPPIAKGRTWLALSNNERFLAVAQGQQVRLHAARTGLPLSPIIDLGRLNETAEVPEPSAEEVPESAPRWSLSRLAVADDGSIEIERDDGLVLRRAAPSGPVPRPADLPALIGMEAGGRPITTLSD